MVNLNDEQIRQEKERATLEVKSILDALEKDFPGVTEGAAALLGSGLGAAGSLGALYGLGTVGLSGAGITSGLATAGALVGGGMVAGVAVLAAPVAALGVVGYAVAKKRKNAKLAAALGEAIKKLYAIQERLLKNADFFKEEIASIKATMELLARKQPA